MTKIFETVCKVIGVILSTILLSMGILFMIIFGIIGFPIVELITNFDVEIKEYFSELFAIIKNGVETWSDNIEELYEGD